MSQLLVPNAGEAQLLTMALKKATVEAQTLKLFTNDVVPAEGDTAATYTEPAGNGYATKQITRAEWNVATDGGGKTTATAAQKSFDFTGGPVTVYGYFVVEETSGILLWAERFDAPANIPAGGGSVKVTPKIELA